jgi:hypothetical protein
MIRRVKAVTLAGMIVTAAGALPSSLQAQLYSFSSCATPGVCGSVSAFFSGNLLSVQLSNHDDTFGSALYTAQLFFANPLNPGSLGTAFGSPASFSTGGSVASIGTIGSGGWAFGGIGGSSELDLSSFANVFIEGAAPSPFRASPGDPNAGTWVTTGNGFVQFTADLSAVQGLNGPIVALGFCTDQSCVAGLDIVTPEPSTIYLVASGLSALALYRRRRSSQSA